jgi:hypothetical protein
MKRVARWLSVFRGQCRTEDICYFRKKISKSPVAECFSGLKMISSRMMFPKNVSKPQGPMLARILFSDLSAWANRQVRVNTPRQMS